LKLPVDSFEQFCLLAKRDETVVQTLLNKKESKNLITHPALAVDLPIQLFADMNIIFGQKGTGKTEIIRSLYDSMRAIGYKCVKYVASEREDDFKTLLRITGVEPNLSEMGINKCENDFKAIAEWVDANPTHFDNYLNWKRTEGNNANKTRMQITLAAVLSKEENEKEESHKNDKVIIDDIVRNIKTIDFGEYLNDEECQQLKLLIDKLKNSIYKQRREDVINAQVIHFVNYTINTMGNSYIDSTIRPMLVNLSKMHKFVVVATHNANIGVRTLPYTSIYRTHSNGIYTTYVGNPFSDKLVNIDDENDVLNWAEESLKSLEGSRDAFYERKDIYESNNA